MSNFGLYYHIGAGLLALLCAFGSGRAKEGSEKVLFWCAIASLCFLAMSIYGARQSGTGHIASLDVSFANDKLIIGERYVVENPMGSNIYFVRHVSETIPLVYQSLTPLPECFVVTNLSGKERYQGYPCLP